MSQHTIPLSVPDIGDDERRLVDEVLRSRYLACGPMLQRFESDFAERFGSRFAVGVSSGTAALHLAMIASGVHDDDLVITTPFSFIASSNAILYERGIPIFVDIDPDTLTIDPDKTLEAINTLTNRSTGWQKMMPRGLGLRGGPLKAIIPVHVFGRPAELACVTAAARAAGVTVVEDACEAIGAEADGIPAGRHGDMGVFAFYPNKQITTGEGGMLITDDENCARLVRSLRSQGRSDDAVWLRHDRLGYNYRLDEMSAALGVIQLRRLEELRLRREAVAALYGERLLQIEGVTPLAAPRDRMRTSWFVYVVRFDPEIDRDRVSAGLQRRGIANRPYFWPIHLQPFYQERFNFRVGDFPHAEAAGRSLLSLPFSSSLPESDIDIICSALTEEVGAARSGRAARVAIGSAPSLG